MSRPPSDETLPLGAPPRTHAGERLLVVTADGVGLTLTLPRQATWVIGRDRDVEVAVDDASLSRRHARLRSTARGVTLEDLDSKNGSTLSDAPLAPGVVTPLAPGAVARLGRVTLVWLEPLDLEPRARVARDHDLVLTPSLARLEDALARVARTDLPVLVLGETGTGKDVVAEHVHHLSRRASGPLVRLHPASLATSVFESELFGHEAGAFTGAARAKPGLFETAAGGTVFLDEIGELPLASQAKLLRVLEDRRVQRVGGLAPRAIDVRFVAATNRDLRAAVAAGDFRADLYQRLRGFEVVLPPLRERPSDVEPLAVELLGRVDPSLSLSPDALAALVRHPFPGNVRELRLTLERAAALARGPVIEAHDLGLQPDRDRAEPSDEAARIVAALEKTAGNQTAAAALLGISRRTLVTRLGALDLPRPRRR